MYEKKCGDLKAGVSFRGKSYHCALELALDLIGARWKIMMFYQLRNGALRSSEPQRRMRDISGKMFAQTARALERDGLIGREVFPVAPLKVEYSLTALGDSAIPVIMQLGLWGKGLETFNMNTHAGSQNCQVPNK
ncbi:MAG: helix-turn-helix transcriptional regulator [Desulfovibrio sp.]|nr:helix-turn-helix transcriptional regulator [Desulfovibrio sp.]